MSAHSRRIRSTSATRASGVIAAQNSRSACRSSLNDAHFRTQRAVTRGNYSRSGHWRLSFTAPTDASDGAPRTTFANSQHLSIDRQITIQPDADGMCHLHETVAVPEGASWVRAAVMSRAIGKAGAVAVRNQKF